MVGQIQRHEVTIPAAGELRQVQATGTVVVVEQGPEVGPAEVPLIHLQRASGDGLPAYTTARYGTCGPFGKVLIEGTEATAGETLRFLTGPDWCLRTLVPQPKEDPNPVPEGMELAFVKGNNKGAQFETVSGYDLDGTKRWTKSLSFSDRAQQITIWPEKASVLVNTWSNWPSTRIERITQYSGSGSRTLDPSATGTEWNTGSDIDRVAEVAYRTSTYREIIYSDVSGFSVFGQGPKQYITVSSSQPPGGRPGICLRVDPNEQLIFFNETNEREGLFRIDYQPAGGPPAQGFQTLIAGTQARTFQLDFVRQLIFLRRSDFPTEVRSMAYDGTDETVVWETPDGKNIVSIALWEGDPDAVWVFTRTAVYRVPIGSGKVRSYLEGSDIVAFADAMDVWQPAAYGWEL